MYLKPLFVAKPTILLRHSNAPSDVLREEDFKARLEVALALQQEREGRVERLGSKGSFEE
jgi:hypothetical protein